MSKSISHRLLLIILKLKRVKKVFRQSPIDYPRLRKEDLKHPKGNYFKKRNTSQFNILDSVVTEIPSLTPSKKLLIFIHGGAFISGPGKHHWDTVKSIGENTDHTIWMCDYPKAPEYKITAISKNIDDIYEAALKKYKPDSIQFIGDSAGGTLVISLIQRLIKNGGSLPSKSYLYLL